MIDHISLSVSNIDASVRFYEKALAPLGYAVLMSFPGVAGLGIAPKPDFWLGQKDAADAGRHVAFRAANRSQVDAFYQAAMAAGGKDNGGPGLRPQYHPNYYGAFVLDPDGNNIEACCHDPE